MSGRADALPTGEPGIERLWSLYLVISRTGLRPGEAIGLKAADLNTENRLLRVQRSVDGGGRLGYAQERACT